MLRQAQERPLLVSSLERLQHVREAANLLLIDKKMLVDGEQLCGMSRSDSYLCFSDSIFFCFSLHSIYRAEDTLRRGFPGLTTYQIKQILSLWSTDSVCAQEVPTAVRRGVAFVLFFVSLSCSTVYFYSSADTPTHRPHVRRHAAVAARARRGASADGG